MVFQGNSLNQKYLSKNRRVEKVNHYIYFGCDIFDNHNDLCNISISALNKKEN
jgi:hypothetical protein